MAIYIGGYRHSKSTSNESTNYACFLTRSRSLVLGSVAVGATSGSTITETTTTVILYRRYPFLLTKECVLRPG